jgi:hypothetical protein
MSVTAPPAAHSTPVRTHWSGAVLFAVAIVTSIAVWIRIVLPVVTLDSAATAPHNKHLFLVLWHAGGGTLMLFAGAAALYIGSTRRFFRGHKIFGYTYLIGGSLGAIAALTLIVSRAHYNVGINAATGTLAAVWLAVAAMAYRAVRNRRFDEHRQWMIRSYVLTWTFVFCRMVMATRCEALSARSLPDLVMIVRDDALARTRLILEAR